MNKKDLNSTFRVHTLTFTGAETLVTMTGAEILAKVRAQGSSYGPRTSLFSCVSLMARGNKYVRVTRGKEIGFATSDRPAFRFTGQVIERGEM